jgi:hypothetical protein
MHVCTHCGQFNRLRADHVIDVWPAGLAGVTARVKAHDFRPIRRKVTKLVIGGVQITALASISLVGLMLAFE